MRAEVRRRACNGPIFGGVEYLLNDVKDGESETVVDVPLAELRRTGGYVITLRPPSEENIGSTCGDLSDAIPAEDY